MFDFSSSDAMAYFNTLSQTFKWFAPVVVFFGGLSGPMWVFGRTVQTDQEQERSEVDRRDQWRRRDDRGGEMGRRWDESWGRDRGGSWSPEEFLRRLDANGDGKLEESELSGRTERYLSGMGFDTSKPVSLTAVAEKIRSDRGETVETEKKKEDRPRRVPGFGAANERVPGFGTATTAEEDISDFGQGILRQVQWVLENYDKDKNNLLDLEEIKNVPAGSPPLPESDTNRDGKLSKMELANRYRAREQFSRRNQNDNGKRGENNDRTWTRNPGVEDRGKFSAEPNSGFRSSNRSRSSGSSATVDRTQRERVPDKAQIDRTTRYVENIIKKYDTDGDGKLSPDEIKASEIRNPPKGDPDGCVTKEAYVNFLLNPPGSTQESSSSNSENSGSNSAPPNQAVDDDRRLRESSRESRFSRRENRSNVGKSRSTSESNRKVTFEDYDEDQNGMIEMHEFAVEWDEATLQQFYAKDKNQDGVITAKEWKGY
jgi:Ca2+-binding EF-hand superfamily protein